MVMANARSRFPQIGLWRSPQSSASHARHPRAKRAAIAALRFVHSRSTSEGMRKVRYSTVDFVPHQYSHGQSTKVSKHNNLERHEFFWYGPCLTCDTRVRSPDGFNVRRLRLLGGEPRSRRRYGGRGVIVMPTALCHRRPVGGQSRSTK